MLKAGAVHGVRLLLLAAMALTAGCDAPLPALLPVPAPEPAGLERSVQRALDKARAEVDSLARGAPAAAVLAEGYGALAMTYHAHNLAAAAEAAYTNARTLAPRDPRWPYLLGQLCMDTARLPAAVQWFEAALALAPANAPALHALGKAAAQQGEAAKAKAAFERLLAIEPARPAALAGLGKLALAANDAPAAIAALEEALRLAPGASRLRHALAMAYRAAGRADKAQAELARFSAEGSEPGVDDPLVDVVASKAATSAALVRRGQQHGQAGRYDLAAEVFAAAAESNPGDAPTLVNLGLSLANLGRLDEAERALVRAVEANPVSAEAVFFLGVLHDRQGRDDEAVSRYAAAERLSAQHVDARLLHADARMRMGQVAQAAALYRQALVLRPSSRARLSLAFALVKGGQWADARALLDQGVAADHRDAGVVNALVRVLAAAPDDAVRNGTRAVQLGEALVRAVPGPEVQESLAMALAERGDFERAVQLQERALQAIGAAAPAHEREFAARRLEDFRQRRPTREPWPAAHPAFLPRSPMVARVAAASGTAGAAAPRAPR